MEGYAMTTTGQTIQMGDVYRAVRDVLDGAGHEGVSYSLDIEWWNHRHDTQEPTATIYVAWNQPHGAHYSGPDFAAALTALEADMSNHAVAVPPKAEPPYVPDVTVEF